jgi:hypothetical protein
MKIMSKRIVGGVAGFLACCLLAGCVMPGPRNETSESYKTLVIGRAEFNFENGRAGRMGEGTYRDGIRLQFRHLPSRKILRVATEGPRGFFTIVNPPAGALVLMRMSAADERENSATMIPEDENAFRIHEGAVHNVGKLTCDVDLKTSEFRKYFNAGYENTEAMFRERHPDSPWMTREWVRVKGMTYRP